MSRKAHEHALCQTRHGVTWFWRCSVCHGKGAEETSWHCARCNYDECASCVVGPTDSAVEPASIRDLLAQLAATAECEIVNPKADAASSRDSPSPDTSDSESDEPETESGADRSARRGRQITKDKDEAFKESVTGAAERAAGGPAVDCLQSTRELATQILLPELGTDLVALVALYAPFRGTEGLFLFCFASQTSEL